MQILKVKTDKRILGDFGESVAVRHLRRKGYRIKRRNFVAESNEIDIIAENSNTVIFVEVKTRSIGDENPREPRPASAVTPKKQRGIISAARCYLGCFRPEKRVRFDIIEVYTEEIRPCKWRAVEIKHLEGAFDANTARPRTYSD